MCRYVFDQDASIDEVGQFDADNTVSYINGSVMFSRIDVQLNYTANATAYNVTISTYFDLDSEYFSTTIHSFIDYKDYDNGTPQHIQYQLQYKESEQAYR